MTTIRGHSLIPLALGLAACAGSHPASAAATRPAGEVIELAADAPYDTLTAALRASAQRAGLRGSCGLALGDARPAAAAGNHEVTVQCGAGGAPLVGTLVCGPGEDPLTEMIVRPADPRLAKAGMAFAGWEDGHLYTSHPSDVSAHPPLDVTATPERAMLLFEGPREPVTCAVLLPQLRDRLARAVLLALIDLGPGPGSAPSP